MTYKIIMQTMDEDGDSFMTKALFFLMVLI